MGCCLNRNIRNVNVEGDYVLNDVIYGFPHCDHHSKFVINPDIELVLEEYCGYKITMYLGGIWLTAIETFHLGDNTDTCNIKSHNDDILIVREDPICYDKETAFRFARIRPQSRKICEHGCKKEEPLYENGWKESEYAISKIKEVVDVFKRDIDNSLNELQINKDNKSKRFEENNSAAKVYKSIICV